ncbi:NAD-dependent epimerase/dehydratase family protein [Paraburkholderia hospita]|uniref:NAD-dependent epimerase/dehydratase family protein n=2 Tax=Paraburkholderia hospita TaxID=169430 RepID=UPI001872D339|nr:NAD-dependent epimerase/dehydratase family protein [Paraburkholderia hospita]
MTKISPFFLRAVSNRNGRLPFKEREAQVRIAIIGGSGHVGTYLVPRLVEAGHQVIVVSRRESNPYQADRAWKTVEHLKIDRERAEAAGTFGKQIKELHADAVIDMICFTVESARHLVEALRGSIQHLLHCGSIWVHGPSAVVPTNEAHPRNPFDEYGRQKAAIEAYLIDEARRNALPATVLHPGHIVGPGWAPLNPAGHFDPTVFTRLATGEEVTLPNFGLETVHHVHADDVAQAFERALANWSTSVGESFHVVSPAAITLRGYAETVAAWFGLPAQLKYLPWTEWRAGVSEANSVMAWGHVGRSSNCSAAKAESLIGYRARYSSMQAVRESLNWLIQDGQVRTQQ